MNKLEYEEIAPDLTPVIGELQQAGFLQTGMISQRKCKIKIQQEKLKFLQNYGDISMVSSSGAW